MNDHNQRENDTTFMLALHGKKGAFFLVRVEKLRHSIVTCLVNNISWLGEKVGSPCVGQHACLM